MCKVAELETQIRDIFNIPRRHKNTRADRAAFNQACSALDAIGDTELALQEFVENHSSFDTGLSYILAYGVLQAIFLQQDAIKHLTLSLGLPFSLPVELKEIRELRNDATGHPTNRSGGNEKGVKSFHHISRATLSVGGFQLMSTYSNSNSIDFKDVKFDSIITIQSEFSEQLLIGILDALRSDENMHRAKYMSNKLTDIFHASLPYIFSKVAEGIRSIEHRDFALSNFKSIMEKITTFEEELKERGEEDSIEYVKEYIEYPAEKVLNYLEGDQNVDMRAAEIFIEYIERQVDIMKQIATEIDEKYCEQV
jgi:hypothetical protein